MIDIILKFSRKILKFEFLTSYNASVHTRCPFPTNFQGDFSISPIFFPTLGPPWRTLESGSFHGRPSEFLSSRSLSISIRSVGGAVPLCVLAAAGRLSTRSGVERSVFGGGDEFDDGRRRRRLSQRLLRARLLGFLLFTFLITVFFNEAYCFSTFFLTFLSPHQVNACL